MKQEDKLEKYLLTLEKQLLKPEIRSSVQETNRILDQHFVEFCSSGRIYKYEAEKVIDAVNNSVSKDWVIEDFKIKRLGEECVLALYKLTKPNAFEGKYSLRSSIWQKVEGKWKMIFHQGTIVRQEV